MPIRTFTAKRKNVLLGQELSQAGDLRLSAKTLTGTGVQELIPGFLYCNGAAISRVTYKRLFDIVGTAYGVGDGSTTFNIPDFRGRFIGGQTDSSAAAVKISSLVRGGILGAEAIALGKTHVPPHTHAPGSLAISGGAHAHSAALAANTGTEESNDFGVYRGNGSGGYHLVFDSGGLIANTHSHPPDSGTTAGNGAGDGLVGTAHQNVHSHMAFGGVLVGY